MSAAMLDADREAYEHAISECERLNRSLYAMLGQQFALRTHRQEVREVVGIRREANEWARYCRTIDAEPCGRCAGQGGASAWPGWTCYDCGGKGHQPASE